jgi:uncharacterized protein YbaR (Trm112 family)
MKFAYAHDEEIPVTLTDEVVMSDNDKAVA